MKDRSYDEVLDRLAALPDDASRIKFLARRPRLLSPSFVIRLDEAVSVLVRVDLKKADAVADAAVPIATELGDNEYRAFALRAKGNALWPLGQNTHASARPVHAIPLSPAVLTYVATT